jgi:c-di-AMP phosphodiesterase-like protein
MPGKIIRMKDYFDKWTLMIILVTLVLFVVALFVKGFTKDLLLEIGVFLVSVKLILSSYKNTEYNKRLDARLDEMMILLEKQAKEGDGH